MKVTNFTKTALLALAGLALATSAANAAITFTNPGSLILGFQSSTENEVYLVNLGTAATYRDATSNISIPTISNLGTDLANKFGSGWASRTDLFWGIVGTTKSVGALTSDPAKTNYVSVQEPTPGTQATGPALSSGDTGNVRANINLIYADLANVTPTSGSGGFAGYAAKTATQWDEQTANGFATGVNVQGSGTGGIVAKSLDLFRVDGTSQATSYEGTFSINSSGVVSYANSITAAPEPSRALLLGLAMGGVVLRRRRMNA